MRLALQESQEDSNANWWNYPQDDDPPIAGGEQMYGGYAGFQSAEGTLTTGGKTKVAKQKKQKSKEPAKKKHKEDHSKKKQIYLVMTMTVS